MNLYMYQRIIGSGMLFVHILLAFILVHYIYRSCNGKKFFCLENFFVQQLMKIVFAFSLVSVIASIIFSDVYFVPPCTLCWYQRALLFAQVIIAGIAVMKKDTRAWLYVRYLSIIGFIVAVYQMLAQFGVQSLPKIACVAEAGADCAKISMLEYGYITIPVMSATFFLIVILLSLMKK